MRAQIVNPLNEFLADFKEHLKSTEKYTPEINRPNAIPESVISKFLIDFDCSLSEIQKNIKSEIKVFWKDKKWDSLRLGGEYLKLFSSKREEDISDKLNWVLSFGIISNQADRVAKLNELLMYIFNELKYDHIQEYNPKWKIPKYINFPEITREYFHIDVERRSDIVIISSQGSLGIEVKLWDESYLKSEEAKSSLQKELNLDDLPYIIILPEEQFREKILYLGNLNERMEDGLKSIPILTWESLYKCIRNTQKNEILSDWSRMAELFLSAVESQVFDFNHEQLNGLFNKESWSVGDISAMNEYLQFRKKSELIENE